MTILEKINSLTWLRLKEILKELKTENLSIEERVDTIENAPSSTQTLQKVLDAGSTATLTQNIEIEGNFNHTMGVNVTPINWISYVAGSTDYSNFSKLDMYSGRIKLSHYGSGNYSGGVEIIDVGTKLTGGYNLGDGDTELMIGDNTAQSTYFKDSRSGSFKSGLEYFADYSSNYTSRSLIDKGYGDNLLPKIADNFANDAAAAIGGIAVGKLYHTAGTVKLRLS